MIAFQYFFFVAPLFSFFPVGDMKTTLTVCFKFFSSVCTPRTFPHVQMGEAARLFLPIFSLSFPVFLFSDLFPYSSSPRFFFLIIFPLNSVSPPWFFQWKM